MALWDDPGVVWDDGGETWDGGISAPKPILLIDGVEMCGYVDDGDLEVAWGTDRPWEHPDAATLAVVLTGLATRPRIGAPVDLRFSHPQFVDTLRVFWGYVTDTSLEVLEDGTRVVSVLAADPLAELAQVTVHETEWPLEESRARVLRIITEAKAESTTRLFDVDGLIVPYSASLRLAAAADETALDAIHDVCEWTHTTFWFRPGPVLASGQRRFIHGEWQVPDAAPLTGVPCTYLPAAVEESRNGLVNVAVVKNNNAQKAKARDGASVDLYGTRRVKLDTQLTLTPLQQVADRIVTARATPAHLGELITDTGAHDNWAGLVVGWPNGWARLTEPGRQTVTTTPAGDRLVTIQGGQITFSHDRWDIVWSVYHQEDT